MVVDDEDADGHETAPRRRASCPRRAPTRPRAARRRAPRARACPTRPRPSLARRLGSKPGRRPRRPRRRRRPSRVSRMLTRSAPRVLDDVRQRLLHDPVERRLDLGRQPLVAELRLEVDAQAASARGTSRRAARAPATRPKSSSADGRSSTASRRTSWSVETTSSRTDATAARASSVVAVCSSGFSPSRIDVSAWPVSSCSSRASRARSSSCASTTRRTASRLTRSREVDGDRRARGERLREAQVVVGEAGVGAALVVRDRRRRSPVRATTSGT